MIKTISEKIQKDEKFGVLYEHIKSSKNVMYLLDLVGSCFAGDQEENGQVQRKRRNGFLSKAAGKIDSAVEFVASTFKNASLVSLALLPLAIPIIYYYFMYYKTYDDIILLFFKKTFFLNTVITLFFTYMKMFFASQFVLLLRNLLHKTKDFILKKNNNKN